MRTKTFIMCLSLGLAASLTSCSFENQLEGDDVISSSEKGKLALDLKSGVEFATMTRVVDESTYQDFDNYNVEITDSRGNSQFSGSFATLRSRLPLELDLGSYDITASYGTERAYSRDEFLVTGSDHFTIQGGRTITCTVNCAPTAGKVLVEFDASMDTYCDTYSVDFSGTTALGTSVAHWGKSDTAPYYLAISENGETVNYTIYLTAKADYAAMMGNDKVTEATATGSFSLERNKAKKLKVSANYTASTEGGLKINVEIDETTNDIPVTIEVPVTWI